MVGASLDALEEDFDVISEKLGIRSECLTILVD